MYAWFNMFNEHIIPDPIPIKVNIIVIIYAIKITTNNLISINIIFRAHLHALNRF